MAHCKVRVCRICFSMDCQLHHLHEDMKLYKAYEAITELALADEEDLPPYLCTDCANQLMNYVRFRKKSFQAHLTFLDIIKHHGHLSVESIQAVIKSTHSVSDNKHTEEKIDIKQEDIPEDPIATGLSDEIKTENIPDDEVDGVEALVALSEVETDDIIKEEVFEEAPVIIITSDNVDDSKLRTDEEVCLDRRLPSEEENKWNTVEVREEAEGTKYQIKVIQQTDEEDNKKLIQNVKLSRVHVNNSETQFLKPLQSHAKTTLHYCYLCDFKTESKKNILAHMTLHSGQSHSSNVPVRSSSGISSQINSLSKDFLCDICKKSYRSKEGLERHMLVHTDNKQYSCDACDKSYSVKASLKNHMQTHAGHKPFTCNICNNAFTRKASLTAHMLKHSNDKPYTCDKCHKSFDQKIHLKRHVLKHLNANLFKCDICDKLFKKKSILRGHMVTHSDNRPYSCNKCEKSFRHRHSLRCHILVHNDVKQFCCEICKKLFRVKTNLQRHMLIHTDDKQYSCDVCEKTFSGAVCLKRHMVLHSVDKRYKCNVCDKSYHQKPSLKYHLQTHARKPFTCDICKESFVSNRYLQTHMLIHTGDGPYACAVYGR